MKKTMMKAIMAATMLISSVAGQWEISNAHAAAATPAPIIRDNLFKFGLKKEVELPVTITSGGFSYTLEKLMIYDVKSNDAQALMKKYGYSDRIYKNPTKYMVWTKITLENKGSKTVQFSATDLSLKWFITINDKDLQAPTPKNKINKVNDKEALYTWVLKPGEKLTSYQMYGATKKPTSISIWTNVGGGFDEKIIVKE
ncbi:hypothetical protein [Paenibacillus sp. 22594]|uniref:hypothetical protein n=1 Tax=Paenibacillus sp. 22594 TaxID=3453947 RepID=UPI003F82E081